MHRKILQKNSLFLKDQISFCKPHCWASLKARRFLFYTLNLDNSIWICVDFTLEHVKNPMLNFDLSSAAVKDSKLLIPAVNSAPNTAKNRLVVDFQSMEDAYLTLEANGAAWTRSELDNVD